MIFSVPFKKAILLSLIGHITMFSIFSLSFGNRIPLINYSTSIVFLGRILENYDLKPHSLSTRDSARQIGLGLHNLRLYYYFHRPQAGSWQMLNNWQEKPAINLAFNAQKIIPATKPTTILSSQKTRKGQVFMIYPQLPYNFLLYFKDRQAVHIELIFNITSAGKTNYVAVKRKISSGNLEADLLAMRYINHYLFIQQNNFSVNNWQTVKIDLSTKND